MIKGTSLGTARFQSKKRRMTNAFYIGIGILVLAVESGIVAPECHNKMTAESFEECHNLSLILSLIV